MKVIIKGTLDQGRITQALSWIAKEVRLAAATSAAEGGRLVQRDFSGFGAEVKVSVGGQVKK